MVCSCLFMNILPPYPKYSPLYSIIVRKESPLARRLERRRPVSGRERGPGCHPEPIRFAQGKLRDGSVRPSSQTLRCAQGDRHSLQMSTLALPNWYNILQGHKMRLLSVILNRNSKLMEK